MLFLKHKCQTVTVTFSPDRTHPPENSTVYRISLGHPTLLESNLGCFPRLPPAATKGLKNFVATKKLSDDSHILDLDHVKWNFTFNVHQPGHRTPAKVHKKLKGVAHENGGIRGYVKLVKKPYQTPHRPHHPVTGTTEKVRNVPYRP